MDNVLYWTPDTLQKMQGKIEVIAAVIEDLSRKADE